MLGDRTSIQFLRGGDQSVGRQPLLVTQHHADYDLHSGKSGLASHNLELLEDFLLNLGGVDEIADAVALNADAVRESLECRLRWDDDRDGVGFGDGRVDANICNYGGGAVNGFKLDVLAYV
jgi:hypothetical protein